MWEHEIIEYKNFLKLERSLSDNSVSAYVNDINKLTSFLKSENKESIKCSDVDSKIIREFVEYIYNLGISSYSQARIISGIKSFFNYLLIEDKIKLNPTQLIESPKLDKKLPDTLNLEDIENILSSIEMNSFEGVRNRAIVETLYSCGLRVSELINLKVSDLYEGEIKVLGKRNKERIIPLTKGTISLIDLYLHERGNKFSINSYLIVTDKGNKLYEKFVYRKVNYYLSMVSSKQKRSPHILRHTFATHMLNNGADLNAIKEILGHENLSATQVYTHNSFEKLKSIHKQSHPRG